MILVVQGETLLVDHVSKNTSDVATAADSTPAMTAYADADFEGQSNGFSLTVSAVTGVTGAYSGTVSTSGKAKGTYRVKITYALSASNRLFFERVRVV